MSETSGGSLIGGLTTSRVQALVDGVCAVAMTLLVLNVQPPSSLQHPPTLQPGDLPWVHMLLYAISFVIVGIYWVGHHNQYAYIKRTDRQFLWINILFLLGVAFIPFSTALIGVYWIQQVAVITYGANLIIVGLALYLHWWYAVHNDRLVGAPLDAHIITFASRRILIAPVAYAAAILLALVSMRVGFAIYLSIAIYVVVPLIYIVPGNIDRHLLRHPQTDGADQAMSQQDTPRRRTSKPE